MVEHCQSFSPVVADALGEEKLRELVQQTWARATAWGFDLRGPVRTVIELTLLFGTSFDTDPQIPWAGKILRSSGEQMARAERLYEETLAYQAQVTGWAERKALAKWYLTGRGPGARSREEWVAEARDEVTRIFPEKASYVGTEGLDALLGGAYSESRRLGLTTADGGAMLVALSLALGHGIARDPLYPMIGEALRAPPEATPVERTERLRKAILSLLGRTARQAIGLRSPKAA
jgi:hypothetical protein